MKRIVYTKNGLRCLGAVLLVLLLSDKSLAVDYYSQSSSDPTLTGNWNSAAGGGGMTPVDFISNGDQFIIQSGHTMTPSGAWGLGNTGSSIVSLTIKTGGVLKADFGVTVNNPAAIFAMESGAKYEWSNYWTW
jgi:hypothetical protein